MTAPLADGPAARQITRVSALEILDSRGRPTVQVTVELGNGAVGSAGVPSPPACRTASPPREPRVPARL